MPKGGDESYHKFREWNSIALRDRSRRKCLYAAQARNVIGRQPQRRGRQVDEGLPRRIVGDYRHGLGTEASPSASA